MGKLIVSILSVVALSSCTSNKSVDDISNNNFEKAINAALYNAGLFPTDDKGNISYMYPKAPIVGATASTINNKTGECQGNCEATKGWVNKIPDGGNHIDGYKILELNVDLK